MSDLRQTADQPPEVLFALPKTRLSVTADEFRRSNEDGTFLTRIPLVAIREVEFRRPFDPTCLVFFVAAAGVTALGYYLSQLNWLSVALYLLAGVIFLIGVFGIRKDTLVIDRDGEERIFDCSELTDHVKAFTQSLQELIERR